jgi:hypothetical protein
VGKGGRCVRLTTLPPSCAVVMLSGNLNFLEPSGTLQDCNGTALHFTFYVSARGPGIWNNFNVTFFTNMVTILADKCIGFRIYVM